VVEQINFPGLKPIKCEAFFRWTEVLLPPLKRGAPTENRRPKTENIGLMVRGAFCCREIIFEKSRIESGFQVGDWNRRTGKIILHIDV
jgi:hypothetical protein